MKAEARAPQPSPDAEALRQDGHRIDQLLDELRGLAGPPAWQRVEELVERLVRLYGAGLSRLLAHARAAGADEADLDQRLCEDELVSSLLVLHDLHPVPAPTRVERALEQVRPYLGSHAGGVELVGQGADGVVRLRLLGTCQGCPSSRATVERLLRRAIETAAPEVTRVDVEDRAAPAPAGALVQLTTRGA